LVAERRAEAESGKMVRHGRLLLIKKRQHRLAALDECIIKPQHATLPTKPA
jgi:hypothetical protein